LLLALRQRWMTTLTAKLDQATYDGKSVEQVRAELAAAQPGLRAVLDAAARRSVRLRSMQHGEQQMVDYFSGPNHPRRREVVA
jgi:ATP adenylyltransferase